MSHEILSKLWSPGSSSNLDFWWRDEHIHWTKQHDARAWEYNLAMRALDAALNSHQRRHAAQNDWLLLDVGGAGSPLAWMVADKFRLPMQIVDPEFNGLEIEDIFAGGASCAGIKGKADFVSCISVLEHVEAEDGFLQDLAALLAPGGVLFLTVDYDPTSAPEDKFMYHWMRKRIYNFENFYALVDPATNTVHDSSVNWRLHGWGLKPFGETRVQLEADATQPPTIPGLGYTFASLCMRKE